jgi:peptidoglycan hydrolase-like protein with peptidoglycan-binding domain
MSEETTPLSNDAVVAAQSLQDSLAAAEPVIPAVVEEPTALAVEPETLPTVFAEPEPEVIAIVEVPAADPKKAKGKNTRSASSLAAGSEVLLSKVVFESKFAKNSDSVRSVQTRLIELGYTSAGDDRQGWISDGTASALAAFVADSGLEAHKLYAEDTINALFEGTGVVVLP